ncbi:two-component response regulator ORR1-like [Cocos nucifera]|uniref:Two-component response regulator ORR1-like n=1 Tax=Cocos nucifera TaxID=13894 RepID=A0A8K0I0E9_COCNU|nr:two-component response regulator ORR1-like [Cocos nucifera]
MGEVTEGDNGKVDGGGGGGGEGGEVRVLVVDDSAVDRRIVEGLLKRSGTIFEVIAVDSGKKAMEVLGLNEGKTESPIVNDKKIDIILTDYCMPEMTGYDLLKAVKEQNCRKSIPVVIMSSENEPQRINRCRAIGAEDFILKPLQTKDVQKLRSYARPMALSPKAGTKRKMPLDLMGENSGSERRPRLAEMAVA